MRLQQTKRQQNPARADKQLKERCRRLPPTEKAVYPGKWEHGPKEAVHQPGNGL